MPEVGTIEYQNQASQVIAQAAATAFYNYKLFGPTTSAGEPIYLLRFQGTRMKLHYFFFPSSWLLQGEGGKAMIKQVLPNDDGWDLTNEQDHRDAVVMLARLHRKFRVLNPKRDYTVPLSTE
eukprot:TRINITY_DN3954_c0_g1_i2.p2 TRINITY_DN3954_c0_g1~~TRINITY_DN3954_c0_g1_i2.p2  ORF type:complete len:122 (-),score=21.47 TRINITY_DN3954_c0_g1_i2:20-385(-)